MPFGTDQGHTATWLHHNPLRTAHCVIVRLRQRERLGTHHPFRTECIPSPQSRAQVGVLESRDEPVQEPPCGPHHVLGHRSATQGQGNDGVDEDRGRRGPLRTHVDDGRHQFGATTLEHPDHFVRRPGPPDIRCCKGVWRHEDHDGTFKVGGGCRRRHTADKLHHLRRQSRRLTTQIRWGLRSGSARPRHADAAHAGVHGHGRAELDDGSLAPEV